VEVRDDERYEGSSWVSDPGNVGVLVIHDSIDPMPVADIEAAINATSLLALVTTPDGTGAIVDADALDGGDKSGSFAGGIDAFTVAGLDGNAIVYENAAGVAEVDAGCSWTAARYDVDGNPRDGFARAYLSRGFRMTGGRFMMVLILPYPTTLETERSIRVALESAVAAGSFVVVERRLVP
jgi:hypothetical protein